MSELIIDRAVEQDRLSRPAQLKRTDSSRQSPQKASRHGFYLGVDGGGTKTHAVIMAADLNILGEGQSCASNPLRVGLQEAISNINLAITRACAQAGIKLQDISRACIALAGIGHPIHFHTLKDALSHALGISNLQLVTDVRAALHGALDGSPGVVIIAGTGSIAYGVNQAGEEARSGGWGPTISDEGSGYDIARRALRAVIASFDGRSQKTSLTEMVCHKLGIESPADIPGVIYNSDLEPVEIANLACVVTEAARSGDGVARQILAEAGEELAKLAISVIERLKLQSSAFRVACVGSVFNSGEFVLGPMRAAILRVAPAAEIGPPISPPAIGAAKLAKAESADER
jgi:N-acetylglucosamine kinase-like BadF-type ATPase